MDLSELGVLTLYLDLDKMVKDSITSFARIDNTALYLAHGQQAIYPYGDAGVEQYLSNSGDTSYRLERIGGVMRFIVHALYLYSGSGIQRDIPHAGTQ